MGQGGGLAKLFEHLGEHQFLALHAAQISHFVVAEAEEAFQLISLEPLGAWVEIDVEALAVIGVNHPLGHVHIHAPEGVAQAFDGLEVDAHIAINRCLQQVAQLLFDGVNAAVVVEGVGLHHPVLLRFHEGVPGHLGEQGFAVLDLNGEHHIGVTGDLVSAHHQDAPIPEAKGIDQGAEGLGALEQGSQCCSGQVAQGAGHAPAQGNPQHKGHQGPALLLGGPGAGRTTPSLGFAPLPAGVLVPFRWAPILAWLVVAVLAEWL